MYQDSYFRMFCCIEKNESQSLSMGVVTLWCLSLEWKIRNTLKPINKRIAKSIIVYSVFYGIWCRDSKEWGRSKNETMEILIALQDLLLSEKKKLNHGITNTVWLIYIKGTYICVYLWENRRKRKGHTNLTVGAFV